MGLILLGLPVPQLFLWAWSGGTAVLGVLAMVTADSAMGLLAVVSGVALGVMLLREKVRDFRSENWKKQAEVLDRLLEEERNDHEQTRQQLRTAWHEIDRRPPP